MSQYVSLASQVDEVFEILMFTGDWNGFYAKLRVFIHMPKAQEYYQQAIKQVIHPE